MHLMTSLILNGWVDAVKPATAYALVERCTELGLACDAGYCGRAGQEGLCWVTLEPEAE